MLVGSRVFLLYRCRKNLQNCQLVIKNREPKHKLNHKNSNPPVLPVQAMTKRSNDAALAALSPVPSKKTVLSTNPETTLSSRVDADGDTVRDIIGCESKMEKRAKVSNETGIQKLPKEVGALCQQVSYRASSTVARTILSGAGDEVSKNPKQRYQETVHAEHTCMTHGGAVGAISEASIADVMSATTERLAVSTLINVNIALDDSGIELRSPTCVPTPHKPKVPGFALLPMGSCSHHAFDSLPTLPVVTNVKPYTDVQAPTRGSEVEGQACNTLQQDEAVRRESSTGAEGGKQTRRNSCKAVSQEEIIQSEYGVSRNIKKTNSSNVTPQKDSRRKPGEISDTAMDKKREKESKNPFQHTTLKESQKSHPHTTASDIYNIMDRKTSSSVVAERQKVAPKSSTSIISKKSQEGNKCSIKQGDIFEESKTAVTSRNNRTTGSLKVEERQNEIGRQSVSRSRKATVAGSVKLKSKDTKVPRPVVSTNRETKDDSSQLRKKHDETLKSSSSCGLEKATETHISRSIKQQKNAVKSHDGQSSVYGSSGPAGSTKHEDKNKETSKSGGSCGSKRKDRQLWSTQSENSAKLKKQGAQRALSVSEAPGNHLDQSQPPGKSAVLIPTKPKRRPTVLPASVLDKVVRVVTGNVRAICTEVVSLNSSFKEQPAASATNASSDNDTKTTKAGCTVPNNSENQNKEVPNSEAVDSSYHTQSKSKEHKKTKNSAVVVKDNGNCKRRGKGHNLEGTVSSDRTLDGIVPVESEKTNITATTNSEKATKKKNKKTSKLKKETKLEEERAELFGLLPQYIPENDCRMKKKKGDRVYNLAPLFSGNFGDNQSQNPKRPNYFVAVQITNQVIKDGLGEVLASVEALNKKVKPAFIPIDTLHLTMAVMHLPDEEAIGRAKSVLNWCVCKEESVSKKSGAVDELTFDVTGLGNFRGQVVFAKVVEGAALDRLTNIAETLQNRMAEQEIFIVDKGRFTPHITIMKMSKNSAQLRKGGVKKIAEDLYKDCTGRQFGPQTVATLQLCAMNKPKRDNYYHIEHEVPFGVKGEPTSVKDVSAAVEKQVPVEVEVPMEVEVRVEVGVSMEVEVPVFTEVPVERVVPVSTEVPVDMENVPVNAEAKVPFDVKDTVLIDVKHVSVGEKDSVCTDMKDSVPVDVKNSVSTDVKYSMPVGVKDSMPVYVSGLPADVKNGTPVDVENNALPNVKDSVPIGVKDSVPVGVEDCVPVDVDDSVSTDVEGTVPFDAKDSVPFDVKDGVSIDMKDSVPVEVKSSVHVGVRDSVPVDVKDIFVDVKENGAMGVKDVDKR